MERVRNNYDTAEALIRGISGHLTLKLITPVANEVRRLYSSVLHASL